MGAAGKLILVTVVMDDGTVVAGRVDRGGFEVAAAAGPSKDRAFDIIGGVGEALEQAEVMVR